jgi:branched-chain amino acid transport system permease protein
MIGLVLQLMLDGLGMGLIYVLLATGFVMILSIPRVLFVAYGQFYMIGAYTVWGGMMLLKLPFFVALAGAMVICGLLGALSYLLIFRYLLHRHFLSGIVAAIGLMMALKQLALLAFGSSSRGMPSVFPGMVEFGGVRIAFEKIVLMLLTGVIIFCLYYFLTKTKTGRALRAVSFNADVAALQGINTSRSFMTAFIVGGVLAGFAGGAMAPVYAVSPDMGGIILTVLLVVMLGGMSSIPGAALGGIVLGITLSFGYYFIGGGWAQIILFLVIGIIIMFRPGGILGKPIEEL